jgi:cytochrome c556
MISDTRHRTVRLVQAAVILSLLLVAAAFAQTHARARLTRPSKEFASLSKLMKDGIHEQFTFLSFTIWHDSPMTEEKLNSVAKSASTLQELAVRIPAFKTSYFSKYPGEDLAMVDADSAEMETLARSISRAAANRDEKSLEPLLTQLEANCNSCHSKFRQELSSQNVEPTQFKK